jgi:hypothetical protein
MKILELLALKTQMQKCMLTCFKHNKIGQAFFKDKMRFILFRVIVFFFYLKKSILIFFRYKFDETDMNDDITLSLDYEILSKTMPRKKA